jgi:hypothetical protein
LCGWTRRIAGEGDLELDREAAEEETVMATGEGEIRLDRTFLNFLKKFRVKPALD